MSVTELQAEREALGMPPGGPDGSDSASVAVRAERGLSAVPDAQDGLFDQIIEDEALEKALEARQKVNESRKTAVRKYKDADDQAKALINGLGLDEEAIVRVGRFRIKKAVAKGRSVAFETGESTRLTISLLKD